MSRFDTNLGLDTAALGFATRKDEFSVQVSLPNDPHFWIRVETAALGTTISDLNLGKQTPDTTAVGLSFALREAGKDPFSDMTILNIAPASGDLKSRSEALRQVLAHYASSRRKFIERFKIRQVGGKYDLIVSFT